MIALRRAATSRQRQPLPQLRAAGAGAVPRSQRLRAGAVAGMVAGEAAAESQGVQQRARRSRASTRGSIHDDHNFTPRALWEGEALPKLGKLFEGLDHDSEPWSFFEACDAPEQEYKGWRSCKIIIKKSERWRPETLVMPYEGL